MDKGIRYSRIAENREILENQKREGKTPSEKLLLEEIFLRKWNKEERIQILGDLRPYTKRDRIVAATIIQWLGTHIGESFIREAFNEIGYTIEKKSAIQNLQTKLINAQLTLHENRGAIISQKYEV